MKEYKIEFKSIEEDGYPEPSSDKIYVVFHLYGMGYGSFDYVKIPSSEKQDSGLKDSDGKPILFSNYVVDESKPPRWYLDFDGCGHESEITHYFELPEEL